MPIHTTTATKTAAKVLTVLLVIGGVAAGAVITSCGGGDGTRPGTGTGGSGAGTGGASAGTGGSSGSGGAPGGGGSPGAGTGGITNPGLNCGAAITPGANITDFADYVGTTGRWGDTTKLFGSVYEYAATGSLMDVSVDTTLPMDQRDLHFIGTVTPGMNAGYGGGGLQFLACTNVTSFSGVQFTVSGTTTCLLELQFQTFSQRPTDQNPAGGCNRTAMSCFGFPKKANLPVTATATMQTVTFAELTPAFTPTELVALQWQLTVPAGVDGGAQTPCTVDIHIDNVKFIP